MNKDKREFLNYFIGSLLFILAQINFIQEKNWPLVAFFSIALLINLLGLAKMIKGKWVAITFFLNAAACAVTGLNYFQKGTDYLHYPYLIATVLFLLAAGIFLQKSKDRSQQ